MKYIYSFFSVLLLIGLVACSDDDDNDDIYLWLLLHKGELEVEVLSSSDGSPINNALVQVYNENLEAMFVDTSRVDGKVTASLEPGSYTVRVSAQGFSPSPPKNTPAVPVEVEGGKTTEKKIRLDSFPNVNATAYITGNAGVAGALVIAWDETSGAAASAVSDDNGDFIIYNLEPADYLLNAYLSGYLTAEKLVTVNSGGETEVDLDTRVSTGYTLSGMVSFLASENSVVDITLRHPQTLDIIPGLTVFNDGNNNYEIAGVPPGTYLAWASFENDHYVMDPDWIFKNGEIPAAIEVNMTADREKNFSVTDAVGIISPSNSFTNVAPSEIDTTAPVLKWVEYPSASEYAVEVFDSDGNTVWGGFDGTTGTVLHPQVEGASIRFNIDGSAKQGLQDGEIYRWSVTALKWKQQAGQLLPISASEDQMGLFKVSL